MGRSKIGCDILLNIPKLVRAAQQSNRQQFYFIFSSIPVEFSMLIPIGGNQKFYTLITILSEAQEQDLLNLCSQFINSEEEVGLSDLLDLVNSTIPDPGSRERKTWTKHIDTLNETWRLINKEGENVPWPMVVV